jgi:Trk K+ transport system NAD-binding subunit
MVSQVLATLRQRQMQRNVTALMRYVVVLTVVILIYSAVFHALMVYEGQDHSLLTGLYWTLTVMTTLGFGDITFESDLGRAFSILVLLSGVVLLLIVLPFAFIRYFYAPWLEAQVRLTAPRQLAASLKGHVIICAYDDLAQSLIGRLKLLGVPYVVIEPDPQRAMTLLTDGIDVVSGERDDVRTYRNVLAQNAKLVLANLDDATNTNITLTVRETAADVPIVATAEDKDAVDILQLSGATHAVPVKHRLGEHLAAHVSAGAPHAEVIGRFKNISFAELPVHGTDLSGKTIRDTRLRERTGASIVAYWQQGRLHPARPDATLSDSAVAVIVGTAEHLAHLNALFADGSTPNHAVLVIGGGKVGRAATRALKRRGVRVSVIEEDRALDSFLSTLADQVVIGDAADVKVMYEAGIRDAPSVLLTTHDDATNIYLAVYCRKLNPAMRIVSRITSDRNLEAINRAGADFVLSQTALAVRTVLSVLQNRELVIIGEDFDLFVVPVPSSLVGRTIAESGIGRETGLNVIGVQKHEHIDNTPPPDYRFEAGSQLLLIGSMEQRREFARVFST